MPSLLFMGITMPDANYVLVPVGRKGDVAAVDEADWERVRWRRWSPQKTGDCLYAATGLYRGTTSMHRFLVDTDAPVIDHIDGCGLNNRRYNLRPATYAENNRNRCGAHTSCGVMGVTWVELRRLWKVSLDGEVIGHYRLRDDAVEARFKAAKAKYGEFARLT
jgi:hypothetical protein